MIVNIDPDDAMTLHYDAKQDRTNFLTLAPGITDGLDGDAHSPVESDFRHAQEFAKLARNAGQPDSLLNISTSQSMARLLLFTPVRGQIWAIPATRCRDMKPSEGG